MSAGPDDAASLLDRARQAEDELEARLLLAAVAHQAALKFGMGAVLTGGAAADFYASGALGTSEAYPLKWRPSADVDVVVLTVQPWASGRAAFLAELEKLGMRPRYVGGSARVVDIPDLPYILEVVGDELSGDPQAERVVTVLLDGATPLPVRSPEHVILAYAESGWHLHHAGDWTRALAVYAVMKDQLDVPYLLEEAARRRQKEAVERVIRQEPLRARPS